MNCEQFQPFLIARKVYVLSKLSYRKALLGREQKDRGQAPKLRGHGIKE